MSSQPIFSEFCDRCPATSICVRVGWKGVFIMQVLPAVFMAQIYASLLWNKFASVRSNSRAGDADLRDPGDEVFRPYPSSVWPVSKTVRAADVSGCSRHYGGGTGSRPWPATGHSDGPILYCE